MLCARCVSIFQDSSLKGPHHKDLTSLEKAAGAGCRICLHLMRYRSQTGPDEEGENGHDCMLRYTLNYRVWADHFWELAFYDSKPRWAQRNPERASLLMIFVHVCERDDTPPHYDEFLEQAFQDLVSEPWRVRKDILPSRSIPEFTGDVEVSATAHAWLTRCRSSHHSCIQANKGRSEDWRPRRLIDVQDETCGWRLVLREDFDDLKTVKYATLSHCWGPSPCFLSLTSENLPAFRGGVADESLPQSFLDAIVTVRRLGIEYIWVDSLCILQSGDGCEIDWRDNAAEMAFVYANSELNLSVDHASCPADGAFVKRDQDFLQPCRIWSSVLTNTCPPAPRPNKEPSNELDFHTWLEIQEEHAHRYNKESVNMDKVSRQCTIFLPQDLFSSYQEAPLTKRAWVFQERLLSPRVLHFASDRIGWECLESKWLTEYLPEEIACSRCYFEPKHSSPTFDIDSSIETSLLQDSRSQPYWQSAIHSNWWQDITDYTSRELSYPHKDKLVAFASVAKKWSSAFDGGYLAGMFRKDLPAGLLWEARSTRDKPIHYRAPSWSWASVNGFIVPLDHHLIEGHSPKEVVDKVELLDIDVTPKDSREPYGEVEAGTLTLLGLLLPWFTNVDLPDESFEALRYRGGDTTLELNFWHSTLEQNVGLTLDEPSYSPTTDDQLHLLPIQELWSDEYQGRSSTILDGLVILKVNDRSFARVGIFRTNKQGAKPEIDNMALWERIDII